MEDSFNPAWMLLAPIAIMLAIKSGFLRSEIRAAGSAQKLVMTILGSVVGTGLMINIGYWTIAIAFMLRETH